MQYKILIWGSGIIYNQHLNVVRYMERAGEFRIIGVVANLFTGAKILDGYPVISKSEITAVDFDYIIVMSAKSYGEIVDEAIALGVHRGCILPYRVLDIPYLDFNKYIDLKKSNLSIISNNCWGGITYHNLGMECLSPFKNLFLEDDDYIRLLNNLHKYLNMSLEFVRFGIDPHNNDQYPIMCLGDVLVHCNHDENPEDALEKWNRRVVKINYENLFVEMYTLDKKIAKEFSLLNQYENKICFVPFDTSYNSIHPLKLYHGQKEFYEAVNQSAGLNGKVFCLIDLFLGNITQRIIT